MNKILITAVLVGVVGLAPYGIKTITDKTIEERSIELKNNGIKLDIVKSEGYLNSKRDFVLTIEDEAKFKSLLKEELISKYPAYKNILEGLFKKDSKEFDDFLRGIVFKGDISNSNIDLSSDIEVNTYLDKFSDEIMNEIKKDNENSKIILPFLEKKGLSFNMLYTNEAKLKHIKIKDINENIKAKNKLGKKVDTKVQFLGYKLDNNSNNERIIADISLDKFFIETQTQDKTSVNLEKLDYSIDYKNELENSGILEFDKFNFISGKNGLNFLNTYIEAKGEANNNLYTTKGSVSTNDLKLISENSNVYIDDIILKMNASNLDYESLKKINKSYVNFETLNVNEKMTKEQKSEAFEKAVRPLLNSLSTLLNKGFNFDVSLDLQGFDNEKVNLNSLKVDLDATLNKNNINIQKLNNQEFLSNLDAKININMLKTDMESLFKVINPQMAMMFSMYAKEQGDKVIFDIEINKAKIRINGKNLN